MKEWLTAREIAAESLPQLPQTERAVQLLAEREDWVDHPAFARRRTGRGGGMEYHLRLLPTLALVAYKRRHLQIGQVDDRNHVEAETATRAPSLSARASEERDARLAIVNAFDRFRKSCRLNNQASIHLFVQRFNGGELQIEDWVRDRISRLSGRSLERWRKQKRDSGATQGFDRGANRKGKGVLDTANGGAVRITILALLADNLHFSAEHIRDVVESEYGRTLIVASKGSEKTVPLPPIRTFQHYLKGLRSSERVTLLRVQNPDKFRSHAAPRGTGALSHIREPNQLWQIDASPTDALCKDGRNHIYMCEDIATRRKIMHVSKTPRASAVALMMRKAILAWGVPDLVKTDNGSDFVAKEIKRLFESLGIGIELSAAYTPQQKGHVERAIRTFQHDCATMLPGFVGHNVSDRSAIEARRSFAERLGTSDQEAFAVELTRDELQGEIDRWVRTQEHRTHGTLGISPHQAAQRSTRPVRHVDERALDVLLMTVASGGGLRTVTARGIRIDGSYYMTPSILPGTAILARMDSDDLGLVYAFAPNGHDFLGVGICPALSGVDPAAAARALKAMQNEITAEGAAAIKAEIRRIKKGGAYHERILGVREARIPENVVALPKRSETHSTPQIEAARAAFDEMANRLAKRPSDPKLVEAQRRLVERMEAAEEAALLGKGEERTRAREAEIEADRIAHLPTSVRALPESAKAKYVRMVGIRRRIEAGEVVDPQDAILLGRYETTSEFKGQQKVHEAFGDEYLAQ
ncbi:Transposase and inactivated derivative [Fulvimarina pelagi HTCC2506]|uniref:Transposase and inactivated derivative n=1 Tax=Fulvimarina pelagi HTCC2506 TaxID=314231 RepID=Q0FYW5_9HYPH|nr:DDE-type integrase/transposase/recombinase [Fulvimarina pelagi]EAU40193.1 Transposase and inactivated derivative [Fulvimarina pelagi HTCC2506]